VLHRKLHILHKTVKHNSPSVRNQIVIVPNYWKTNCFQLYSNTGIGCTVYKKSCSCLA